MRQTFLIIMILALPIVGCQQLSEKKMRYLRNRDKDYLRSTLIEPLRIPPGLACPEKTDNFPLPPPPLPMPGSVRVALSEEPPEFEHLPTP